MLTKKVLILKAHRRLVADNNKNKQGYLQALNIDMSSSESEDENLKKFAESLDSTVFSDNLYNKDESKKAEPKVELKSQRVLETDESIFQSELNVSSTMQQFIGKKLSKLIEDQVEFVEMNGKLEQRLEEEEDLGVNNVRLLSGSKEVVKHIEDLGFIENRRKVKIKRRKVDLECKPDLKQAVVNPDDIKEEIKTWAKKSKHHPYEYKTKKGVHHLKEPANEFTSARNKNKWSESKIKTGKFHNPPLTYCK